MRLRPGDLFVGADAEKIVVSPYPLTMSSGRAVRRRTGSVVEVVPVPASGRSRPDRARFAGRMSLALGFLSSVLVVSGVVWWVPFTVAAVLLTLVAAEQARAARTPRLAVRPGDGTSVLYAKQERAAFARAFGVSRRIRRSWPALSGLVDPADADRALARSLAELAALLTRRQEIRRLRAELTGVDHRGVPADSAAVLALAAQRQRVDELWRETGATANRMLGALDRAALAGENLIREQQVAATVREAELTLSRVAAPAAAAVEAGPELAERTAAVIAAYRELSGS